MTIPIHGNPLRHGIPIANDGYELGVLKGYTKAELIEEILGTHPWDYLLEYDFVKIKTDPSPVDRFPSSIRSPTVLLGATSFTRVTRYTRAGRYGKLVRAPCGHIVRVYHFAWAAMGCSDGQYPANRENPGCGQYHEKYDYEVEI